MTILLFAAVLGALGAVIPALSRDQLELLKRPSPKLARRPRAAAKAAPARSALVSPDQFARLVDRARFEERP